MKLVLNRIGLVLCLTSLFIISDYFIGHRLGAILNDSFIFGFVGTNLIAVLVSITILVFLWSFVRKYEGIHWPLIFVSAATISNIIERILYGGVVDYFNLLFIPTFNIADVTIIFGGAWLFLNVFLYKKPSV